MPFFLLNSDSFFFYFLFHLIDSYLIPFVGQDQQDWLVGCKLTDLLERRTERIE